LARELGSPLVYASLTDFVQHKAAPGEELSDRFYRAMDQRIGAALDAGYVVGLAADHGMRAKTLPDGQPNVRYLDDALRAAGVTSAQTILPITDPYARSDRLQLRGPRRGHGSGGPRRSSSSERYWSYTRESSARCGATSMIPTVCGAGRTVR
jgi:predicted AlkP superfamily pyrophosphatase or phosphodiesterase